MITLCLFGIYSIIIYFKVNVIITNKCIQFTGDIMSGNMYAFLLSTIAGISTLIGFLFIFIKKDRESVISKALGFASGVMLTISVIDLVPNSFLLIIKQYNLIYALFLIIMGFLIGVIISSVIDKKVEKKSKNGLKLYKLGIITMFVIMMHNIPEGIATFITTTNNINLGIMLTTAIALHNIPEGISISIPIYYSTNNKFKAFLYTLISGMSEPLGALISYLFLSRFVNDTILGIIYSIIAGMMINISINELYKEAIDYNKKNTIIYFIIGSFIMILNHLLFS